MNARSQSLNRLTVAPGSSGRFDREGDYERRRVGNADAGTLLESCKRVLLERCRELARQAVVDLQEDLDVRLAFTDIHPSLVYGTGYSALWYPRKGLREEAVGPIKIVPAVAEGILHFPLHHELPLYIFLPPEYTWVCPKPAGAVKVAFEGH